MREASQDDPRTLTEPVLPAQRVELVDALRGFALLGVVTANTLAKSGFNPYRFPDQIAAPIDRAVFMTMDVLVSGKFMALFSLLFGVGFGLQLRRAQERDAHMVPRYVRRLAGLFLIGILHHVFFSPGDVLKDYAIFGAILLLFRNASDRTVLALGFLVLLLNGRMGVLLDLLGLERPPGTDPLLRDRVHAEGTYLDLVSLHLSGLPGSWWVLVRWNAGFFGLFLLGFYAARRRLLEGSAHARAVLRPLLGVSLLIAVAGRLLPPLLAESIAGLPPFAAMLTSSVLGLGGYALTLAYSAAFALVWYTGASARRLLAPLAQVGRLALTNYLSVSVLGTFVFFGFRLTGSVRPSVAVGMGLLLFGAQIVWSRLWLRRHRFGPVEWLWRSLTYGRIQPMLHATGPERAAP